MSNTIKVKTHIEVKISTKEKLEEIRDREGYKSMDIVIEKLIKKCGSRIWK